MTDIEKLECFSNELVLLENENLRKFVETILIETGDWFYHDPASTSGNHHPLYALGDGGLVRHTRAVVFFLKNLYLTQLYDEIDNYHFNLLLAAAILHDIRKHTADGKYVENHARAGYEAIMETQKAHPELISEEDALYMAIPISTHMGVWGVKQNERAPQSQAEKILHIADYLASRRDVILNIFD